MQAAFEMTEGRAKLEQILADFPPDSAHWNEAQNRFQFVDRLLTECLGWEHPYIEVERTDELGGKADYVLGKPAKAILEAKREAKTFDTLPTGKPTIIRKLGPLLEACPTFQEAVRQVISYSVLNGAQIAIVCNGPQLAIFQALIIGQSPLDGECYLFNGAQSYLDNFPLLWNLMSPEGIAENKAYRKLAIHRNPRIPPKASTAIGEPLRYRYRSGFQENLRSLASVLLEDVQAHPDLKSDFYKDCYVPIEANNRHLLLSKKIIAARYQRASDSAIAPAPIDAPVVDGKLKIDEATIADAFGARPVVVIGDVGVGKTSFFENLFEKIDNKSKDDTFYIYINLGTKANLTDDIKAFIISTISEILKSNYKIDIEESNFVKSIYHKELLGFDNSVKGKLKDIDEKEYQRERISFLSEKIDRKDAHIHACLGHLAQGRNKQILLVLDNADQRKFETQQEAFLIAQEFAASRNMLVFIALRPSTFYQSKTEGALTGYQNRVLTIAPPPADEVLRKRIAFAVRVAEGKIAPAALERIRLNVGNIVSFLNATLRSIRGNEQIRRFLSNITGGNTRLVIELITGFCGSPNVESEKIVRIERETRSYQVPLHEFTKHALLGEYAHYNPQSSLVAFNVFDVSMADPREHFLACLILGFLSSSSEKKDNDGFLSGTKIINEMREINFVEEQVRHALRELSARKLIETPYGHYREIRVDDDHLPDQFHYRVTSIGIYHVRYWMGDFSYLDATSIDTPIFDEDARIGVFDNADSFAIEDRLKKSEIFRKYIEQQWYAANITRNYFDIVSVFQSQDHSFEAVRRVVAGSNRRPQRRGWRGRQWR